MKNFFVNRSKELQSEIDKYLDRVQHASMIFNEGVKCYIDNKQERFNRYCKEISDLETDADHIRRDIKYKLYYYMLIPEARGDVLGLLESLDNIVDMTEKVLEQLEIEKPVFKEFLKDDFRDLAELSSNAVDELVKACQAFFMEIKLVNNYINKVHFYEHEADKVEKQLKVKAFTSDEFKLFSQRVHMRYFAERIVSISDEAETVCDKLAIYAIKRRV